MGGICCYSGSLYLPARVARMLGVSKVLSAESPSSILLKMSCEFLGLGGSDE